MDFREAVINLSRKLPPDLQLTSINSEVREFWMRADLASAHGRVGLDIGAGTLRCRPFFNTETYTAIEPNERVAAQGRDKYPDAKVHICRIEDYEPSEQADVALACKVIGNNKFDVGNTLGAIEKIIGWIAPGGSLFIDTRPAVREFEAQIDALLNRSFQDVQKRPLGRFPIAVPRFLAVRIARNIAQRPAGATNPLRRPIYYACRGKI